MTTINDLKNAIDQILNLNAAGKLLSLNSNKPERAYEAYVLSLCVAAVRKAGGTVILTGVNSGVNPPILVFRGAPGSMASRAQNFCYADCELKKRRFEIHVDVEYEGQSGATHEIDVSIYDAEWAARVRSAGSQLPRTNKPLIMAFECKFYTSTPGVGLARAFIGLVSDCASNKLYGFVANKSTESIDMFLSKSNSPEPFTDLSPSKPGAEERFIGVVEHALRKWASGK